ncbi:MAG: T9SS type A sorting domain-containing protein [Flavobacterium sp.]|nr:T9SS type A sorting domain-containing protein [Flavobacterium sp.]
MRKFVINSVVILIYLLGHFCSAQLYVSNNYVYVADKYLYVKQDVNIQNSGNLYLRNESQLLQAKTGSSANSGAGTLSVFQEGTVNSFAYNYWCSPVGNSITASGNEPFGITMLNQPTSAIASTPATMLSMSTYDGIANPLSISQGWIFKFLSSSLYSQWFGVYSASTLNPGEGFTMKGTGGTDASYTDAGVTNNPGSKQRYDFRGRPNDGDITISLATGMRTLTGNPYPSAIDLRAFLLGATNSTGIAYFWEQDKTVNSHFIAAYKGGYGTYSTAGPMGTYVPAVFYAYDAAGTQLGSVGLGSNYERRFCPIGQGFMLESSSTGNVTMENSYRVYQKEGAANFSQFERTNAENAAVKNRLTEEGSFLPEIPSVSGFDYTTVSTRPAPQIRINTLLNNEAVRQSVVVFQEGATDGVDFALDAKSPDVVDMDMYFVINDAEYIIDVLEFDINKGIPIGFKNPVPATFKLRVGEILNLDVVEHVYLHNKISESFYEITNEDYEISLPAGVNNSQYELTFVNSLMGVEALTSDSFQVLQNNTSKSFSVLNPVLKTVKSIQLYDIAGKLIMNATNLGATEQYQYSTLSYSDAIYIVKITTSDNQVFNKKITVYNGQ